MIARGIPSAELVITALAIQATRPRTVAPPAITDRECGIVECRYETKQRSLLLIIRRDQLTFRGVEKRKPELHIEGSMPHVDSIGWLWSWLGESA